MYELSGAGDRGRVYFDDTGGDKDNEDDNERGASGRCEGYSAGR